MPVPHSARGNQITGSAFEAPFESPVFPYGVGGLDLASPIDRIAVGRFSRLTNVYLAPNAPGGITGRPGLTALAAGTGNFHSVARLGDPQNDTFTYLWGVGSTLAIAASGAVSVIDTGYSGEPLALLPYHPPLSEDPWMYVGDRLRMRKVRADGLDLPIALPAPTVVAVTTLGTAEQTALVDFQAADGSQASAWTATVGQTIPFGGPAVDPPITTDVAPGVEFRIVPSLALTSPAGAGYGFYSFWGLAKTLNLTQVGSLPATDDDLIHLLIRFINPMLMSECRIYFVCSPTFSPSVLPGTADGVNTDFYIKAFRPDDFAGFINSPDGQVPAAEAAAIKQAAQDALNQAARQGGFHAVTGHAVQRVNTDFLATADPARAISVQGGGATPAVTELGIIGVPLRRGDFRRYGTTTNADWSTVTGVIIYVSQRAFAGTPEDPLYSQVFERAAVLSGMYLLGGAGPDTADPATQSYDYRYTNFDPRTGDESNPSPEMADAAFLDSLRTAILATPAAYGDSAIRQRFYRRGGVLTDDWFFLGANASDGGVYTDTLGDLEIAAAGTLALDNYEPVPTVNDAGTTILGQPVPILIGPYNGQLFALGDPYRPGTVYASKPGEPDHWPPDLRCEVCSPSEELLNGVMYAGQILLFSREGGYFLYPNLAGQNALTANPSGCTRGLAGRWALTTGAGAVWGVAKDGVFTTTGGPESIVSDDLAPLFRGQTVNGYAPIDFVAESNLRLSFFHRELWFTYQDTNGDDRCFIFTPETKVWRAYDFASNVLMATPDDVADQLILGLADRAATHTGTSDLGDAITWTVRTGAWDWGRPREEKLFGDQFLDVDTGGAALMLQNFVNNETITNAAQALTAAAGRKRVIFDSFGTEPQRGRNLATEIRGSSATATPTLYLLGTAITPQPDITINRVTNWDDLGAPDESYVMGITLDANTSGENRTVYVERDWQNAIQLIATLTVNHDGRHKRKYSWPAVPANQVRLRPANDCGAWLLFRADWISQPEPPRIAVWDSYFENAWDQYLTGLDLYCDTSGLDKQVVVQVDGVTISDPATGLGYFTVNANGRQVVHLTLPTIPPLRGHVLHFSAQDANPGLLYDYRWQTVPEPSEQANWNEPFTILGTQADKWVKAVIFEVDTFGQDKAVAIEADGSIVSNVTVNTHGRKVVQLAIAQQLGRVWRFLPTDAHPSRLYSLRLVFDEEPFALTRWETQELDYGQEGFFSLVAMMLTLKSNDDANLRITTYVNQLGDVVIDDYTIPSTAGIKLKRQVQPLARKGVLYKFLLTIPSAAWVYEEESFITIQPWSGGAAQYIHALGNSDVSTTRRMINASIAAADSGGGS